MRSSMPLPKKQTPCIPMKKFHCPSIRLSRFSKEDWHSDEFWVKEPRHSENIIAGAASIAKHVHS